jgi:RND family efflux transporter MFP subunit
MTTMIASGRSYLYAGVALAAGLGLAACGGHGEGAAGSEAPPLPVSLAAVEVTDISDTFEAGGVVQARSSATLTSRILAPIREVRVEPGERVRTGQVLVVLDGADLAAQARSARAAAVAADQDIAATAADRQAAEAALTLARAGHERIAGLHARRSATAQELDEATAALRRAEANAQAAAARARGASSVVDRARASADAAATTASFSTITAPFDGLVTEKLVDPGNMAAPGMPLLRVEDMRGFRLEVRVDESRVPAVTPGEAVRVLLDSGTQGAQAVEGTVSEVSRAIDADARAFLVKIALPDTADVRSGTFGRAIFRGATRKGLRVPDGATVRRGQMTSVFVVENDIARLRLVSLAGQEVKAGLSAGDLVIVDPPPELADGRRVTGARR